MVRTRSLTAAASETTPRAGATPVPDGPDGSGAAFVVTRVSRRKAGSGGGKPRARRAVALPRSGIRRRKDLPTPALELRSGENHAARDSLPAAEEPGPSAGPRRAAGASAPAARRARQQLTCGFQSSNIPRELGFQTHAWSS